MMHEASKKLSKRNRRNNRMAKWMIQAEDCKGCGLCVDACPKKILLIDPQQINHKGHSPVKMTDETRCTGCGFCSAMCPDCVITIVR